MAEAMPAFQALSHGSESPALTMTVGNNTHGYINETRVALYSFFSRHLLNTVDSGIEAQPAFLSFVEMRCTTTGSVLTAPELNQGHGSVTVHQAFVVPQTQDNLNSLQGRRKSDPSSFLKHVRSSVGDVVGFSPLPATAPVARQLSNGTNGAMRFSLPGEGRCQVGLEVRLPPTSESHLHSSIDGGKHHHQQARQQLAVLYVSRKGSTLAKPRPGELSEVEEHRLTDVVQAGFAVVLVDVCGFGTLADQAGDAFGLFDLPSRDYRTKESHPVDAMYNVGRSLVGLHAADVLRAAQWTQGVMKMTVVATVSANETAAAVLVAALVSKGTPSVEDPTVPQIQLGGIALVSSVAAWSQIALEPRYDMSSYYAFVFGVLQHFDLPDIVAALNASVLVAQPLNALRQPVNETVAATVYSFSNAHNKRLDVKAGASLGAAQLTDALMQWLRSL